MTVRVCPQCSGSGRQISKAWLINHFGQMRPLEVVAPAEYEECDLCEGTGKINITPFKGGAFS